jgi:hypothetical protein
LAFGQVDVVKWWRHKMKHDDLIAPELAQDFVQWTDGNHWRHFSHINARQGK